MEASKLRESLIASINKRFRSHSNRDLQDYIFSNYLFTGVDAAWVDFAFRQRGEISEYLSSEANLVELIQYCIRSTKEYTYQRNQYVNFTEEYDALMTYEYRDFMSQIKRLLDKADSREAFANTFAPVLERHHQRLRLIMVSYCISYQGYELPENPLLRTVPCEEYSALFQLQILKLDFMQLEEPILDIGCGVDANLVAFLRENGLEAYALDRLASSGPYTFQEDWFNFEFARKAWGTIIAHQSLSIHFIHNHLHNPDGAEKYASLFMNIIASLKPGGTFYYAPGLPFFEGYIADLLGYSISKVSVPVSTPEIADISYSTQLKRI
jgi:hypothetical protein